MPTDRPRRRGGALLCAAAALSIIVAVFALTSTSGRVGLARLAVRRGPASARAWGIEHLAASGSAGVPGLLDALETAEPDAEGERERIERALFEVEIGEEGAVASFVAGLGPGRSRIVGEVALRYLTGPFIDAEDEIVRARDVALVADALVELAPRGDGRLLEDETDRESFGDALGDLGPLGARGLIALVDHPRAEIREAAIAGIERAFAIADELDADAWAAEALTEAAARRGLITSEDRAAAWPGGAAARRLIVDEGIPVLVARAAGDEAAGVRRAAVDALGPIAMATRRVDAATALVDALGDDDTEVREVASSWLYPPREVPRTLRRTVRARLVEALAGAPTGSGGRLRLARGRREAADLLADHDLPPEAVPRVLAALGAEPDLDVRLATGLALARAGGPAALDAAAAVLTAELAARERDGPAPDPGDDAGDDAGADEHIPWWRAGTRLQLAAALAASDHPIAAAAFAELLRETRDPAALQRSLAAELAGEIARVPDAAAGDLIESVASRAELAPPLRARLAEAVIRIPAARAAALGPLVASLGDAATPRHARRDGRAARLIAALAVALDRLELAERFLDAPPAVAAPMAVALLRHGEAPSRRRAARRLVAMLDRSTRLDVGELGLETLVALGPDAAAARADLEALLGSREAGLRGRAAIALTAIAPGAVDDRVIAGLELWSLAVPTGCLWDDYESNVAAVRALGRLGARARPAAPRLEEATALGAPFRRLRREALAALVLVDPERAARAFDRDRRELTAILVGAVVGVADAGDAARWVRLLGRFAPEAVGELGEPELYLDEEVREAVRDARAAAAAARDQE